MKGLNSFHGHDFHDLEFWHFQIKYFQIRSLTLRNVPTITLIFNISYANHMLEGHFNGAIRYQNFSCKKLKVNKRNLK